MAQRRPVAVLGCGAVGRAFALALGGAGERLLLWSRTAAHARSLAREVGPAARAVGRPAQALEGAAVALLCLPEGQQSGFLARHAVGAGAELLTVSGATPLQPLARAAGRPVGRLHPLVPVLREADAESLRGMPFGLEGVGAARREARRLCRALAGLELALSAGQSARYHAGAALLGGGLIALLELAERAMTPAVRDAQARRRALALFAARNLAQFAAHGAAEALTGPIARGSEETVRAHLAALATVPGADEAYRALGRTMVALARRRSGAKRTELARILRALAE